MAPSHGEATIWASPFCWTDLMYMQEFLYAGTKSQTDLFINILMFIFFYNLKYWQSYK